MEFQNKESLFGIFTDFTGFFFSEITEQILLSMDHSVSSRIEIASVIMYSLYYPRIAWKLSAFEGNS